MFNPEDHKRINDTLLGPLERPALAWLASRMPSWVTPDVLTGLGLVASLIVFISYVLTNYDKNFLWLASFGFLLNWLGDSLDGTLARYRHIERPHYGFYIDHITDAIAEVLVFLGLGLSPYVSFTLACLALVTYLMASILVYIIALVSGVFRISNFKLGPTEFRTIAILANTVIYFIGNPVIVLPYANLPLYDVIIAFVIFLLLYLFVTTAVQEAVKQAQVDQIKLVKRTRVKSQHVKPARKSSQAPVAWKL